jgi:hypothetical protein
MPVRLISGRNVRRPGHPLNVRSKKSTDARALAVAAPGGKHGPQVERREIPFQEDRTDGALIVVQG